MPRLGPAPLNLVGVPAHSPSSPPSQATFYKDSMKSSHLRGRQSIVPCANILGGGSSINFQMYTRASFSDWDDFKAEGWNARKDLLPLMKRVSQTVEARPMIESVYYSSGVVFSSKTTKSRATTTRTARAGRSASPTGGRSLTSLRTTYALARRLEFLTPRTSRTVTLQMAQRCESGWLEWALRVALAAVT